MNTPETAWEEAQLAHSKQYEKRIQSVKDRLDFLISTAMYNYEGEVFVPEDDPLLWADKSLVRRVLETYRQAGYQVHDRANWWNLRRGWLIRWCWLLPNRLSESGGSY